MYNDVIKQLESFFPLEHIKFDEPMKNHTSFKIGGPADVLLLPGNEVELSGVLKLCSNKGIKPIIIGNGSNLLVLDEGIRGIVIKMGSNMDYVNIDGTKVSAGAGILLSKLASEAARVSLAGFEFASGIPGTLGGAVFMNAGAYGGEMKDVVFSVNAVNISGDIKTFAKEEMEFGYRHSIFHSRQWAVTSAQIELQKGDQEEIKAKMVDLNQRRREKQPLQFPSAGSTFKRPPGYFAGTLIDQAGLKGTRVGDAEVSELHAGFIINRGNATANDVLSLIKKVQQIVYEKFKVELVPEVQIIGGNLQIPG